MLCFFILFRGGSECCVSLFCLEVKSEERKMAFDPKKNARFGKWMERHQDGSLHEWHCAQKLLPPTFLDSRE